MTLSRQKDISGAAIIPIILIGICLIWLVWPSDKPDQTAASPRAAPVDFSKPLFVKEGMPGCPTADDVNAMSQAALAGKLYVPGACGIIKHDTPVVMLENAGGAGPYRVRFIATNLDAEAWVPYAALKN